MQFFYGKSGPVGKSLERCDMVDAPVTAMIQLAKMAGIAAAAGAGPAALLLRPRWRHGWLALPLLVNCGLGLIALVAVRAIYGDQPVGTAVPQAIGLSGLGVALAVLWKWRRLPAVARSLWTDFRGRGAVSLLLLVMALIAIWPGIRTGGEQPY